VVATEPAEKRTGTDVDLSSIAGHSVEPSGQTVNRDSSGYDRARPEHLPEGFIIDKRFEIRRKLGQGGFGAVYLVHDHRLEIKKALMNAKNSLRSWRRELHNLFSSLSGRGISFLLNEF